ncbi:GSK3-beta interaction protein isoform X1 [Anoplolepis gracilipes]|uniref:GSK3-beta interaction protein isoform X1 n=1 Tax=Anoplolepis gracilipes TaxID=354296 RepID=UPI003BA2C178
MRDDADDRVLDEEQWRLEAQAVINDVRKHVRDLRISEQLISTNQVIYLNLTTLEGLRFCVELSAAGFAIVGNRHDDTSNTGNERFETPYSLLDFVSPQYRNSFGSSKDFGEHKYFFLLLNYSDNEIQYYCVC